MKSNLAGLIDKYEKLATGEGKHSAYAAYCWLAIS